MSISMGARRLVVGFLAVVVTMGFVATDLIAPPASAVAAVVGTASTDVMATADRPDIVAPRPSHDRPVSAVPVNWTPQVRNGKILDVAQVGSMMVLGGDFTEVAPSSGTPLLNRTNVFAFSAINGAINTNFAPSVSGGQVRTVEPGPTPGTVYLGGSFQGVNGVTRKLVLVDVSTGQLVPGFNAPAMNGAVNDIQLVGDRLYVGGIFTSAGGPANGLVSLNATTGARDSFLSVALTENQNYTGGGGAQAGVGAKGLTVTPQGDQLAVIGNFRKADGLERRQMVLIDLTGQTAQVREDWKTDRLAPACFSNAFDSYVRGVNTAPDGSYFLVATTGGPNPGTLCDTLTRWDIDRTGSSVQPEWIDDTGGDTLHSTASSGAAVYTGGHQRWMNNHGGRDNPAPGAVGRAGLGAVEVGNGLPIAWNPGRSPRGVGAESLYVSDTGLWVGSDTEQIGHHTYRRPRIAFFPVAGGTPLGAGDTGALPSNVYKPGSAPAATNTGTALYRVNTGGPALAALDGGPDWMADSGATNSYRNAGSNAAGWGAVPTVDGTVPAAAPRALFDSERWDPQDNPSMQWAFPVEAGKEVVVRLYFANRCDCTSQVGQRAFDVRLEGNNVLTSYDIVGDVGDQVGTMKSFTVTSDGTINLEWLHRIENPLVNGIEILESVPATGPGTPVDTGLTRVWFTGAAIDEPVLAAPGGDLDWTTVRGAVVIDGQLFYGTAGGDFMKRTFDGQTYGAATAIDPYNDPYWSNVDTGSGGYTYRGVKPSFYGSIPSLTGMAFDDGTLYYTLTGSNRVFSRKFSPDSGVITQAVTQAPAFTTGALGGIFFDEAGENLFFVTASTGTLSQVGWNGTAAVGSPVVVSGPDIDGVNWSGRALFLASGPSPAENQAPAAVIGAPVCDLLSCAFDGTGSSDPDSGDSIASYTWDFGDGSAPETGATPTHEFTQNGTYTVTLTVTDQRGLEGTTSRELTVSDGTGPVLAAPTLVGTTAVMRQQTANAVTAVPDGVQAGDLLMLFVTSNYAAEGTGPSGAGAWTLKERVISGDLAVGVYTKVADGSESGQSVSMTWPASNYRTDLTMLAYRGVGEAGVEAVASSVSASASSRTTPTVSVAGDQRLALSFWADRSSSTTGWTAPEGVDVVSTQAGSGGGRVSTLITSQAVSEASYGGLVASTNAASPRGATLTLTLAPGFVGGPPANEAPTAVIAPPTCDRLECTFDGSGSADPEGQTLAYSWDFGDDSAAVTEMAPTHTFPEDGTYVVTLTVTDDKGATGTATVEVEAKGNQAPMAVIADPVCDLLSCAFDGTGSSDPDSGDSIASYTWDFGDDTEPVTDMAPTHVYAGAGSYTVTLTVTDQSGAQGTTARGVVALDGSEPEVLPPTLVGTTAVMRQQTANAVTAVPDGVQAGDLLMLFVTSNYAAEGTGPSGAGAWTLKERVISGDLAVGVYTKVADGSESGQSVSMTWPASNYRTDLTMLAYRGVGEAGVEAVASSVSASASSRTTPTVSVAGDQRLALSFWADRSSSTTGWTAPEGVDVVSTQAGSGGGRVSTLITSQAAQTGTYGGLIASSDAAGGRGVTMTLALTPGAAQ